MLIKENANLEELEEIFEGNNQGYIKDKKCIFDDKYLKCVALEEDKPVGYAVIYFENDFIEKEGWVIDVEINGKMAYVWNCITKKGYEKRGVQTAIFKYFTEKFSDRDIYSAVDYTNNPSMALHKKMGFIPLKDFTSHNNNYVLLKKVASK